MAVGDAAAAAGLAVFAPSQDVNEGANNDNIRGDELAYHMTSGTHPWNKITGKPATFQPATNSVGTPQIMDVAVTTDKIATGNVTTGKLANESVTNGKLAPNSVTASRIADGAVATEHYQDLSVTTSKLRDGAVTNGKLDTDSVTASRIAAGAIQTSHLTDNSVAWEKLTSDVRSRISNNTSSIRYKEDVEDAVIDTEAILNLRPVTFVRKNDPTRTREFGLIAEEVEEAGAHDLVVWRYEQIDGVRYDRLAVALIEVVRQQRDELAELTERVTALEQAATEPPAGDLEIEG